jgi:hypothetical protein
MYTCTNPGVSHIEFGVTKWAKETWWRELTQNQGATQRMVVFMMVVINYSSINVCSISTVSVWAEKDWCSKRMTMTSDLGSFGLLLQLNFPFKRSPGKSKSQLSDSTGCIAWQRRPGSRYLLFHLGKSTTCIPPTCVDTDGLAEVEHSLLPMSGCVLWAGAQVKRTGHTCETNIKIPNQCLQGKVVDTVYDVN